MLDLFDDYRTIDETEYIILWVIYLPIVEEYKDVKDT